MTWVNSSISQSVSSSVSQGMVSDTFRTYCYSSRKLRAKKQIRTRLLRNQCIKSMKNIFALSYPKSASRRVPSESAVFHASLRRVMFFFVVCLFCVVFMFSHQFGPTSGWSRQMSRCHLGLIVTIGADQICHGVREKNRWVEFGLDLLLSSPHRQQKGGGPLDDEVRVVMLGW